VPVRETSWGFKSPLAHAIPGFCPLASGVGLLAHERVEPSPSTQTDQSFLRVLRSVTRDADHADAGMILGDLPPAAK
jgi:hypothetical protein